MRFLSKETCEKLTNMGCQPSEPRFDPDSPVLYGTYISCETVDRDDYEDLIKVFTVYDFLSTERYAKKNCEILFGKERVWDSLEADTGRFNIIMAEDDVAFLEEFVGRIK